MKTYISLIFFVSAALTATERFELDRQDGTKITGYYDRPETSPFAIILILPGSQKETSSRIHNSLKNELLQIEQCPITLEKQGITEEQIDEKEFVRSLSIEQRLNDHLQLYQTLQENLIPGWNGKLTIIGQGDGGRVGAALGSRIENLSALILVAAGGGWLPMDEALYAFRVEMADQGYSPQYIHGFMVQARQEFAQALKAPKVESKAFGYTHKYWDSFLRTRLLEDLVKVKCPIYSVNGVKDERVPIESVEALSKHLKDKIVIKRKENSGREIMQDPKTYQEAISWLESKL